MGMRVIEVWDNHIIVGFDFEETGPTVPSDYEHEGIVYRRWQCVKFGTFYEHLKKEFISLQLYALSEYHNRKKVPK